jgi:hypothetical protein
MWQCLRYTYGAVLLLPLALGCNDARPQTESAPAAVVPPGSKFDPKTAGTVQGRVTWEGPIPDVPPFKVRSNSAPGKEAFLGLVRERPNVPRVDPESKGVMHAVVFLRGVEPQRSRPWHHPPARVEIQDMRLKILQGNDTVPTAFVRRGDSVTMVAHDKPYHILHASGADYFTYTFSEPGRPRSRQLDHAGLVELASASGCYWMRGYLFVDDHPYYTRTDAHGCFCLEQVPPGDYQLVCWLPNWHIVRQDRDAESSLVARIFLAAPVETVKTIAVTTATTSAANFTIRAGAFAK